MDVAFFSESSCLTGLAAPALDLHSQVAMNDSNRGQSSLGQRRSLNVVTVFSPCEEPWNEMRTVGHTQRFCDLCSQNVYDISMLSREEAEALIFAEGDSVCVRLTRRYDGTVVTSDCGPVRHRLLRKTGRRVLSLGTYVLLGMVAILAALGVAGAPRFHLDHWLAETFSGPFGATITSGMVGLPSESPSNLTER